VTGEIRSPSRTGRRPGDNRNREAILAAARAEFAERGYDRATIRDIATAAAVDPALVMYFFGSKQELFLASIELAINPAEAIPRLLEGGLDQLGERLVAFYLGLWNDPDTADAIAALTRSAFSHDEAASLLREFLGREIFGRLAPHLRGRNALLRAELAGAHLVGLAVSRYIVGVEPLASASDKVVVAAVGPVIQRYLTG
jgi:AcrR family transcriptional regulator